MTMLEATTAEKVQLSSDGQYCTFRLGNLLFGVAVLGVQEVLLEQHMTRMPLATEVIAGLINLRGQIVTAIDMRRRLGMPAREDNEESMNVVIRCGDTPFSLIVDEIGDVVNVKAESFEEPPETLTGTARELILGTYKLEKQLLLVLDTERAVNLDATFNS